MKKVDVLVVGAGPGGLAAGIIFARNGLRTLVCEKKQLPLDKPCGEGLMPRGVASLHALGVDRYLSPGQYHPFKGIRYYSPAGFLAVGNFTEGPGWGIPRVSLSAALTTAARTVPNLEICENISARIFERRENGVFVRTGNENISTRLLVGADGLNSNIRRWAGLSGKRGVHKRWGASQHFNIAPWSDYVEVFWAGGIEAYITPLGADQIGVAFLWSPGGRKPVSGGAGLLTSLLKYFPELEEKLAKAPLLGEIKTVGPLQRNTLSVAADGVVLVGDASGYLDAITGEGISLAFDQALTMEKTIVPLLKYKSGTPNVTDLFAYIDSNRKIQRSYLFFTRLALFFSHRPHLTNLAVRLLAIQPVFFQRLLSASMR